MKRVLELVAGVAVLVAAVASMTGTAQAGWSPPIDVSPPVTQDPAATSQTDMAALPDGGFVYVWATTNQDFSHSIVSRVAYPDGTFSPINVVSAGSDSGFVAHDPENPSVATSTGGRIRVAWKYEDMVCSPGCNYSYRIQSTELDEDGLPGTIDTLDNTAGHQFDYIDGVSLSMAPDGNALLAWVYIDNNTTHRLLKTAVVAPGQTTITPVISLDSSNGPQTPSVAAMNGGGGFLAIPFGLSDKIVGGMMIDPTGDNDGLAMLDPGPIVAENMNAVIDSNGTGTAIYHGTDIGTSQVWMRKLDSDSDPVGAGPVILSNDDPARPAGIEQDAVALAADGKILVPFHQAVDGTGLAKQQFRTINTDGSLGPVREVDDVFGGSTFRGHAATSPDGGGSILYLAEPPSGPSAVMVQSYDSNFNPVPSATTLGEQQPDSDIAPYDIAYSGNGDGASLWLDFLNHNYGQGALRTSFTDLTPPTLDLWIQPKAVQDQEIVLGAEASDRNGATVTWDFGDGGTATGNYVRHTFASAGTFQVKVTATDGAGNKTVKTSSMDVLPKQGQVPPPEPPIPPDTAITGQPAKSTKATTATFQFTSSLTGSKFECRLDKAGWTDCTSPKKLKKLKPGKHTFKVRAIKGDLVDATPASYGWTIKKSAKKSKKGGRS